MNIFILDSDPEEAARQQCNKHIVKMPIESVQLLSSALPPEVAPCKYTHVNHPCAVWVRQSLTNYKWLLVHAAAQFEEYTRRYGREHATEEKLYRCFDLKPDIPDLGLTPFARAIKEPWKEQTAGMDIVEAYRTFYVGDKARFAKWQPRATTPAWWPYKET